MQLEVQSDSFGSFSCHKSKGFSFNIVKLVRNESSSVGSSNSTLDYRSKFLVGRMKC